jgi:hypothetical protein
MSSNPLHRAGSVDHNAKFAKLIAEDMASDGGAVLRLGKPVPVTSLQLSVQVAEPLYTHHKSRLNCGLQCTVLSSLNGVLSPTNVPIPQPTYGPGNVLMATPTKADCAAWANNFRDSFFKAYRYAGFSNAVHDQSNNMKDIDLSVARAGLIVAAVDSPVRIGSHVVVDVPRQVVEGLPGKNDHVTKLFTPCEPKHGSGDRKLTLVIRALTADDNYLDYRRRGQVIGKCTKGNNSGKGTIDIMLGHYVGAPMGPM